MHATPDLAHDASPATPDKAAEAPHTEPATRGATALTALLATVAAASTTACGGGGGDSPTPAPPPPAITEAQASRFLAQASMGATRSHISAVQTLGYEGWLDQQIAMPPQGTRFDWLLAQGYGVDANRNTQLGYDPALWRKLLSSPDTLRQRITWALHEILVTSIDGLVGGGWRAFSGSAYVDLLEAHAFGNYRSLLQAVSTSPAMGMYLTFRGNVKANAATGSSPDENYAREILQLFTIGLLKLNLDGSLQLLDGQPQETYTQADISGLARVFTGWDFDTSQNTAEVPQTYLRVPMVQIARRHETGPKVFLGTTIPAGTDGVRSLELALDAIFAHPNVAPFVSRQLIQRLVTSNPSADYVQRVAQVFNDNGHGERGDLAAVVKAILLDAQARSDSALASTTFGKLREPILRFTGWARAFNASSPSEAWPVGNTTDAARALGQSPGRSPSVFNFFRPGYVPPNSALGTQHLVAPEFQITNESSVVGYVNFMQKALSSGLGDLQADYTALQALVGDSQALLAELNTVLAAGQISSATLASLTTALDQIDTSTSAGRDNRLHAALTLVLASPEFIALK